MNQQSFSDQISLIPTFEPHPSPTSLLGQRVIRNDTRVVQPAINVLRAFVPHVEATIKALEERIAHLESAVNKAAEAKPAAKKETAKA